MVSWDYINQAGFSILSVRSALYAGHVVCWQEDTTAAVTISAKAKMICRVFIASMFNVKLIFIFFLC